MKIVKTLRLLIYFKGCSLPRRTVLVACHKAWERMKRTRETIVLLDPRADDGAKSKKQVKRQVLNQLRNRPAGKEQREELRRHSRTFPM